jgi:hypothetical protein
LEEEPEVVVVVEPEGVFRVRTAGALALDIATENQKCDTIAFASGAQRPTFSLRLSGHDTGFGIGGVINWSPPEGAAATLPERSIVDLQAQTDQFSTALGGANLLRGVIPEKFAVGFRAGS